MAILNAIQKQVLNQIKKSAFLRNNFYFTGGTVLSEFYLQDSYYDDLDFFSLTKMIKKVKLGQLKAFYHNLAKKVGVKVFE